MLNLDFANLEKYRTRTRIIRELKDSNLPVIVYGTGKFAYYTAKMLLDNDIELLCFFDHEKYWYSGKKITINNYEYPCVLSKDYSNPKRISFNLLLGMIDYSLLKDLKKEFSYCKIVDYLDAVPSHVIDIDFLKRNKNDLTELYNQLSDEESMDVMEAYLHARYTGDIKNISMLNHDIRYLYDWDLLKIKKSDIVVDGGAFDGDTIKEIKEVLREMPNCIFAFEPDISNLNNLLENLEKKDLENIKIISVGLYSKDGNMSFVSREQNSMFSDYGNTKVTVQCLDGHSEYKNVTLIKMDIEGCELEALYGAKEIILKNKPRLAISIYHKNDDIVNIYNFLKKFDYSFYLRHIVIRLKKRCFMQYEVGKKKAIKRVVKLVFL